MNGRALTALDPTNAERLARLLGMLGSTHDGEIANAGRLADKLVRRLGLTWNDVIAPRTVEPPQPEIRSAWHEPRNAREAILIAMRHIEILSDWEQGFIRSLGNVRFPSPRQFDVLCRIISKIRETAMADAA